MLRDGRKCQECGCTEEPQVDHIVPFAEGGSHDMENLQVLCRQCNRQKGDSVPLTTSTVLNLSEAE